MAKVHVGAKGSEGYWGDITSSVDFCETNYALSQYIAEPANSLSSFIYVFHGGIGYFVINNLRNETTPFEFWGNRLFAFMYLGVATAGFGSVLLHGTLLAPAQAADEVPMLIISMSLITTLLERKSGDKLTYPWIPPLFTFLVISVFIIYFSFQQFYFVFVGMYVLNVTVIVFWTGNIALKKRSNIQNENIRKNVIFPLWISAIFSYVICGMIAWITDFVFCDEISQLGWWAPMVLHPIWHFGTSIGAFLAIQVIAASRGEILNFNPYIKWWWHVLPYVTYENPKGK